MSIELVMPSNHLILYCPLLLLPSIFPSIRVFSKESILRIRWPKYWSFSFNISPSNEHPGLISFRMDWLDLLAVQGTLKSLLQHHSSKASILLCSAFFTVQLSYPYMTTGKTIALTRWTFVDKVMSLLFNILSRLVITFLPRSKRLLISWLKSPSAVIILVLKHLLSASLTMLKAFDCVDHNKLWKILKKLGIPDHLTCLLRNLYIVQEATVRTGHGTADYFQIGKGVHQGCTLSHCLFNLHAEYIMQNAGLDEVYGGIKISGRNINNLRYVDDTLWQDAKN